MKKYFIWLFAILILLGTLTIYMYLDTNNKTKDIILEYKGIESKIFDYKILNNHGLVCSLNKDENVKNDDLVTITCHNPYLSFISSSKDFKIDSLFREIPENLVDIFMFQQGYHEGSILYKPNGYTMDINLIYPEDDHYKINIYQNIILLRDTFVKVDKNLNQEKIEPYVSISVNDSKGLDFYIDDYLNQGYILVNSELK